MENTKLHIITGMEPGAALGRKINANFAILLGMLEEVMAERSQVKKPTKKTQKLEEEEDWSEVEPGSSTEE